MMKFRLWSAGYAGTSEKVKISFEVALVCNEEALFLPELQWNRIINSHLVIKGTFFLCGLGTEDFTDLPDELLEKYKKHFWDITHFIPTPNGLLPITVRDIMPTE